GGWVKGNSLAVEYERAAQLALHLSFVSLGKHLLRPFAEVVRHRGAIMGSPWGRVQSPEPQPARLKMGTPPAVRYTGGSANCLGPNQPHGGRAGRQPRPFGGLRAAGTGARRRADYLPGVGNLRLSGARF